MRKRPSSLVHAVLALCGAGIGTPSAAQDLTTTRLGPTIYLIRGDPNGNVLVSTGPDGLLLVDAQAGSRGSQLDREIRTFTDLAPRLVINTHYHEDHTGGNDVFRARGATILAHHNLAARALVDTTIAELGWHREPADSADLPSVHLNGNASLRVNGSEVRVLAFRSAHTDTDLAVFFPAENVLHTGDIVEVVAPPFVDWWGGGSLRGIIAAVDRMLDVADANTRIVPGHGPALRRPDLERYREMLQAALTGLTDAIREGLDMESTVELDLTATWDYEPAAGRRFIRINYLGLTTQPQR